MVTPQERVKQLEQTITEVQKVALQIADQANRYQDGTRSATRTLRNDMKIIKGLADRIVGLTVIGRV